MLGWLVMLIGGIARGAEYEVGPERKFKELQAVAKLLQPGDVVTVDGGVTYPGGVTLGASGTAGKGEIRIIGKRVNGMRPVLKGVTGPMGAVLRIFGSHYVVEGFDMTTGGDPRPSRCFYNVGDDVTLRDSVVHDCNCTGISGSDASGSLTLDRVEVHHCGNGLYAHQIYVGSSLAKFPAAVFRMERCYIHDGTGGNNVKSRVTRNEIEYNWIEGAAFHELDLVGPDPKAQKIPPSGIHCDADVIGNVLVETGATWGSVARLGSDGTGASNGRYRFAYNTIIVRSKADAQFGLIWMKGEVDAVTMWNNVFWSDAGPMRLVREESAPPPVLAGQGNWLPEGTSQVPPAWKGISGGDPGFVDGAEGNYWPAAGSPLIGAGCVPGIPATEIPGVRSVGTGALRPVERQRDIGAFPMVRLQ